ncbi:hypothetical protein HY734_01700 [Candidatus Uhrbacteria bacterium]|nr:hypothetical protein [Candidatus Uhrbacteria bacterium]
MPSSTRKRPDAIILHPLSPRDRLRFYAGVTGVSACVLGGWLWTVWGSFLENPLSLSGSSLGEVGQGVKEIVADVRENVTLPTSELTTAASAALAPVQTGIEQRQAALETVTELMEAKLAEEAAVNAAPETDAPAAEPAGTLPPEDAETPLPSDSP